MKEQTTRFDIVARRFGVEHRRYVSGLRQQAELMAPEVITHMEPGKIILLEGASGSGKSLLLQAIADRFAWRASVASEPADDQLPVIETMPWLELEQALEVLGRFGLGEVYTYLSPVRLLSTGQRARLRLALAYARMIKGSAWVLAADEFATQLDRVSAKIIARNLSRVIEGSSYCAIVATCHDDLRKALRPAVVVRCDFGQYAIDGEERCCRDVA